MKRIRSSQRRRCLAEPIERRLLMASISGSEFNDFNNNGVREVTEPGISGVTLFLDANNNGVLDAGETTTTSDSSGNFSFTIGGSGPSNWVVAQQTPAGFVQTKPLDSFVPGLNLNLSKRNGNESEGTITIDPSNPNRIFVATNISTGGGLFGAVSTNGGASWTTRILATGTGSGGDGIPTALSDPSAAFDAFGNLYLTYINSAATQVVIVKSTDGGGSFSTYTSFTGNFDQPTIVTGPGSVAGQQSVWITFETPNGLVASGAAIPAFNSFGSFSATELAPGSIDNNYGDIAVGPTGQVMIAYQTDNTDQPVTPTTISVNLDSDGLGAGGFGPAVVVGSINVQGFDHITPQNIRSVDSEVGLAWDRTGGPHNGRLYMVYTDEEPDESNNTDIYLRYSDNNGSTWSPRVRVNDDATAKAQFLPKLAIDQTTGNLALAWYDSRNSPGNDTAQLWGTISTDAGATFQTNKQISAGTSNAALSSNGIEYGDYIGLAFHAGNFFPLWADNSNSTGDNPNGSLFRLEIYASRVLVLGQTTRSRYGVVAGASINVSGLEFGNHDVVAPAISSRDFEYLNRQAINFSFSEDVSASLSPSDLTLTNLTTATTIPAGDIVLSYDSTTNTATFTFTRLLADGNYHAELNLSGVTDPSGNALASTNSTLDFFVLAGDANRDRTVDVTDLGLLATFWQESPRNFGQGDFNYDHVVDVTDLGILATNWQATLPAPAPAPLLSFAPSTSTSRRSEGQTLAQDVLS